MIRRSPRFTLHAASILFAASLPGCHQATTEPITRPASHRIASPVRGIWVVRSHYHDPRDIRAIMQNCRRAGINTVYWQVRGNGTVAYRSSIEPWSAEYDYRDPGFDPLQVAVAEAHAAGLRIEAWVNMMPGWRGPNPPPDARQLYNRKPDWFIRDASGARQPLDDFYVILNPCLPEVRDYLVSICREIASKYDVDGIHMDYIRFAWDTTPNAKSRFPRDPRTLDLFRSDTGSTPDQSTELWNRWRASQVTRLVAAVRSMLRSLRPEMTLTAAVHHNRLLAYDASLQNGGHWLRSGLVDAIMPMAYTTNLADFEESVSDYRRAAARGRVIAGVGAYKHNGPQLYEQLRRCISWGGDFVLFSYTSLFSNAEDRRKPVAPHEENARAERRSALLRALGRN